MFGLVGAGVMFAVLTLWLRNTQSSGIKPPSGLGLSLRENPLFLYLSQIERQRWPSLRATVYLTLGLLAASAVIGVQIGLYSRGATSLRFLILFGLGVLFFTPMIVAAVSATMALQHVADRKHQLLRLTLLSDAEVVSSYVFATLYRLRVLLAIAIGPTPLLIAGQLFLAYRVRLATRLPEPPLGPTLLKVTMVAVGLWGANLLAAAIGVLLASLARRASFVAITYAPVAVAAIMTPMLSTLMGGPTSSRTAHVSEFMGIALFMLMPYLLGYEIMRLSRRWIWRTGTAVSRFLS